jgi:hypothetical protein
MDNITPPIQGASEFHCPLCSVYSKQRWSHLNAKGDAYTKRDSYGQVTHKSNIYKLSTVTEFLPEDWSLSKCEHCEDFSLWLKEKMIFPKEIRVLNPNKDLSEEIKEDYFEAANVLNDSPRSSAAILRLVLQKLCIQLGEKGEYINDDIKSLVKKGLSPIIQKSLDSLRITGNNAVHPGEINLTEDTERVIKLFKLINFIAEKMITEPKEINEFYDDLPEKAKSAVEKRDSN